jgi:dTDP-D-glucose 4,6-dehydratase
MLKGQDTYSVYNVSNYSNEVSNLDLINFIGSIMNKEPKIKFVPDRLNHDYRYYLSYNNALRHGWFPQINLKQGLKEIVEYYENQ